MKGALIGGTLCRQQHSVDCKLFADGIILWKTVKDFQIFDFILYFVPETFVPSVFKHMP